MHKLRISNPAGITRRLWLKNGYAVRLIQTSSALYKKKKKKDDCKVPSRKPCPKTGSGRGFYHTLGAVIIGTSAVVAYAKYDDDFRAWLKENIPGSDEFISFVTAEETTHVDYIMRTLGSLRKPIEHDKKEGGDTEKTPIRAFLAAVHNAIAWVGDQIANVLDDQKPEEKPLATKPPCDEEGKPYSPKKAVEKRMKEIEKEKKEEAEERRREKEELESIEISKKKKKKEADGQPTKPTKDRKEIEKSMKEQLEISLLAYAEATCILRKYTDDVKATVENSVEKQDPKIWPELQKKTAKKEEKVKQLFDAASKAESQAQKLRKEYNDPKLGPRSEDEKENEVADGFKKLKDAKEEFIRQKNMANVTNTYWTLVKQAREHFQEQLSTLFPDLSLSNKQMKLAEAEMDLFILYAFQTILHYQRELNKLDQMSKAHLKSALEKSKIGDPDLIECVIEQELAKEKDKICEEYKKKLQDLKADCEKKANEAIKSHNAMHTEMLQDALSRKEQEVTKKMKRQLDEQLIMEKEKYREEMAGLLGRLKGMDELMKKRATQEKIAVDAQLLWSACEGLYSAITCERDCAAVSMRALGNEIRAIQLTASKDDELVQAVVKAIPQIAYDRGIFAEPALKERFTNTARVARRVALLPEGGASLPMMMLSYLQSILVFSPMIPMPCFELASQPVKAEKLNTFELLQLSKYWMDRGDWYQVLRYMNMLKGASRVVAQDFLDEVKIFLETKQAADVLIAHASISALPT